MSAPGTTPGPWKACEHPEGRAGIRAVNGSKMVARCEAMFGRGHVDASEWEANAHLIAASPALYEALEIAMEYVNWLPPEGREAFKACAAALAIARGETA